jgi:hypothetical protein
MNSIREQCRRLNVQVGDTIQGTDKYLSSWNTTRLTLLWLGDDVAVWRETWRSNASPEWSEPAESADWTLDCRDWRHVGADSMTATPTAWTDKGVAE